ncbi:MAG TPA: class I SAM-dependent methyltransferase [Bryobacteraceae bacterium]|nr:class I SAM-dependent methyltransferase [Bryobacteraceae bacterium]
MNDPCKPRNDVLFEMKGVFAFNQHKRDIWVTGQSAQVLASERVLDAGAGDGRYRRLFSHCEYRTHDFGQEPSTIGRYTALDYQSDILSIPVADESFDVILCTEVLEHVPYPIETVQELARILRPGGKLLLTAPLGSFLHQEPYHYYGGYTPYWYQKFLPIVGLRVESIERNQGFFSWFAQEAIRFSTLLDPRRIPRGWRSIVCFPLWLLTLPLMRLFFPLVALFLDRLGLEQMATVGYHVVARKTP